MLKLMYISVILVITLRDSKEYSKKYINRTKLIFVNLDNKQSVHIMMLKSMYTGVILGLTLRNYTKFINGAKLI